MSLERREHKKIREKVKQLVNSGSAISEISQVLNIPAGVTKSDKKTVKWYLYCISRANGANVTNMQYKEKKQEWGRKAIEVVKKKYDLRILGRMAGKLGQEMWKGTPEHAAWSRKGGINVHKLHPELRERSKETLVKYDQFRVGKSFITLYGEEKAKEISKVISLQLKNYYLSHVHPRKGLTKGTDVNTYLAAQRQIITLREKWKDPVFVKKMMGHWNKNKQNELEKRIEVILNTNFPGQFKWTGDGSFSINGRTPDFTNCNGQKKIIEVNGIYWHLKKFGLENNSENKRLIEARDARNVLFREFGYKTLFLWEDECKTDLEIIKKIQRFENE